MRLLPLSVLLTVALAGCAGAPHKTAETPPPQPASAAAPAASPAPAPAALGPPANDALYAVAWTQTAVEHDLIYREVFRDAGEKLRKALHDPHWDALPKGERKSARLAGLKPAVIVDIDETVLDNSPYQAWLVQHDKEFDEFSWSQWCREKAAKPLPGALEFTQNAAKLGVTVFYLSNRAQDLNDATLENLSTAGFPLAAHENVFLGLGTIVKGCEQIGSEKGCRRELIGRKYRVLMQFGDQIGDFVDVIANTPDGRTNAVEPYLAWFGERWFVLPNPNYGSWQPALFNNDWTQPLPVRRKAMQDALHPEQPPANQNNALPERK